ncbi:FUSC family protein [Brevibacterium album]|uniref:FUSC family protein n=1 Tax=Brevibacterium album TaxID=417948 RepID=UPI00041EDFC6|nr:aromatic acid exporter family protein [Brevibacterium album]
MTQSHRSTPHREDGVLSRIRSAAAHPLDTTVGVLRAAARPEIASDLLQVAKSVVAATAAWWLAVNVLESPVPFLAPWVALLTVFPTLYQSVRRGLQTTVASWLGVGLSFVIGNYLGVSLWTFALALLVGLALARVPGLRTEGVAVATTAIFVLGAGFDEQAPLLDDRLLEVAVGAGVGIAANLLLLPPLRDREAARYVDSINRRMGEVLVSMAEEFASSWDTDRAEAWMAETQSMSEDLDSAWQTVRGARESRWANPRRLLRTRRGREEPGYEQILGRVDESVSHLRNLVRTLREASAQEGGWDTRFREEWSAILGDAGRAIADPDAHVEPVRERLHRLTEEMSADGALPRTGWPLYGALISSAEFIVAIVDDVASTREAREE